MSTIELCEQRSVALLAEAYDTLRHPAYSDDCADCCGDPECSIESPRCDIGNARRARHLIDLVLTPRPEPLQPDRLTNPAERIFFEQWKKENERRAGINRGYTLLEWLLCPTGQRRPGSVTIRDMQVATAVVQWLGTNCGLGFLWECNRKLVDEKAGYRDFVHEAFQENANRRHFRRQDDLSELAHWIASRYKSIAKPDFITFEQMLVVALNRAFEAGKQSGVDGVICAPIEGERL